MTSDEGLEEVFARICANDREAMRRLYQATGRKVFGVIVLFVSDEARQRDAMLETYSLIWNLRADRAGIQGGHLAWVLAIARRTALRFQATPPTTETNRSSTTDRLPHFDILPAFERVSLSPLEQSMLVDAYVSADGAGTLEKRYNLKSGELISELRRIIRTIGDAAK